MKFAIRRVARCARLHGLAAAGLALAGCATQPGAPPDMRFAPPPRPVYAAPPPPPTLAERVGTAFAWSISPGSNAISGRVAWRPAVGESWTCAGQSVGLTPETAFSTAHIRAIYGSAQGAVELVSQVRARSLANPGVDYSRYLRTAVCDAHGAFSFGGLPDGAYYMIAPIRRRSVKGAEVSRVVMQRVELRGGGVRQVSLPERPPSG